MSSKANKVQRSCEKKTGEFRSCCCLAARKTNPATTKPSISIWLIEKGTKVEVDVAPNQLSIMNLLFDAIGKYQNCIIHYFLRRVFAGADLCLQATGCGILGATEREEESRHGPFGEIVIHHLYGHGAVH